MKIGHRSKARHVFALAAVAAVLLAGCSDSDDTAADGAATTEEETADGADHVFEVRMLAGNRFEPESINVEEGETVTFKLINEDDTFHDFTVGDEGIQAEHAAEMAEMGTEPMEMDDEPDSVTVKGGATEELTFTFTQAGTLLYGCHQPGHYDAGMKGTVTVS